MSQEQGGAGGGPDNDADLKARLRAVDIIAAQQGWPEERAAAARRKISREWHLALMDFLAVAANLTPANVADCKAKIRAKYPE